MNGVNSRKDYPDRMRRIRYRDPETQKSFVFLTNNFTLAATTITKLYRARWRVELFFKWIKQHLRIKAFVREARSHDPNHTQDPAMLDRDKAAELYARAIACQPDAAINAAPLANLEVGRGALRRARKHGKQESDEGCREATQAMDHHVPRSPLSVLLLAKMPAPQLSLTTRSGVDETVRGAPFRSVFMRCHSNSAALRATSS